MRKIRYDGGAVDCRIIIYLIYVKEYSMKKLVLIALTSMAVLSACNTVSGAGKDIKAAGGAVTEKAEEVKSY